MMALYANYNRDVSDDAIGRIMGPDLYGAFYEAVEAVYDPETDQTKVLFLPVAPNDQREVKEDYSGRRLVESDG